MSLTHSNLIDRYPRLKECSDSIVVAIDSIERCFRSGGKLIIAGNGGSAADADHICGELLKSFANKRSITGEIKEKLDEIESGMSDRLQIGFPAVSLSSSVSFMTAFSNDMDSDWIYAQHLLSIGKKEDVLMVISTSGNSRNVVNALKVARAVGIPTIALTGRNSSRCSELANIVVRAPGTQTHEIQELHLPIYHAICLEIENRFFDDV